MRISDLSRRTGVPVATVKFYLRERLLPAGLATAPNQADYGDDHVHRLRLIRALREVGGLGIERIRRVVGAIDDEALSRHDLFGVAQRALDVPPRRASEDDATRGARRDIDRFLAARGWRVRDDASARDDLAAALVALRRLGRDQGTELFEPYADVADRLAAWEVGTIPAGAARPEAVERMVVGTVVFGAVLDALRRLAHEHHSATRAAAE